MNQACTWIRDARFHVTSILQLWKFCIFYLFLGGKYVSILLFSKIPLQQPPEAQLSFYTDIFIRRENVLMLGQNVLVFRLDQNLTLYTSVRYEGKWATATDMHIQPAFILCAQGFISELILWGRSSISIIELSDRVLM